ncbi:MAG: hypothetical protein VX351_05010, partial [Planctomycetota bacterium]
MASACSLGVAMVRRIHNCPSGARHRVQMAKAAMVDHDYGSAMAEVAAEGYEVPHRIPCSGGDRDVDMAASGGRAQLGFARCFAELRPDVALVTADRFEMLAPAITIRIPIVYVE